MSDWGPAVYASADHTIRTSMQSPRTSALATQRAHGSAANETGRVAAPQLPLLTAYLATSHRNAAPMASAMPRFFPSASHWPPSASASSSSILRPTYRPTADGRSTYCWEPVSQPTEPKPSLRAEAKLPPAAVTQEALDETEDKAPGLRNSAGVSEKKSRYLRERDRRTILSRIATGEKQALLAREYKVTRAAICYLKKHRADVLARSHANPMAKHPKKPRRTMMKTAVAIGLTTDRASLDRVEPTAALRTMPMKTPIEVFPASQYQQVQPPCERHRPQGAFIHELQSLSVALLLTTLENSMTSTAAFRRNTDRIMRLLVEEALASVAVMPLDVFVSHGEQVAGLHVWNPSCAISMMPAVCPLLTTFQQLEPDLPGGYAHVKRVKSASSTWPQGSFSVDVERSALPAVLEQYNTFVLDLVAKSGPVLCAVVSKLLERGAIQSMITIVALFVSSDAIAMVHEQFPEVRFLMVHMDESKAAAASPQSPQRPSRGELYWKRFTRSYGMRLPNDWHNDAVWSYGF